MAPSRFLADLIKFTFLIFPDPSGSVGTYFPDGGQVKKLAGSGKKNQVNTSTGTIFRAKTKKRYSTAASCYQSLSCYFWLVLADSSWFQLVVDDSSSFELVPAGSSSFVVLVCTLLLTFVISMIFSHILFMSFWPWMGEVISFGIFTSFFCYISVLFKYLC